MAKIKTSVLYLPRPATKYPGCYPMHFERRLPEILETESYVHFFAGMSRTGFRIDCKPEVRPNLVANVEDRTPFPNGFFKGGVADPPYTREFAKKLYGTKYPKWSKWTQEFVRLVEPGGRLGIMQNYIVPRMIDCDVEEVIVILTRIKQFPKIFTVQRKRS